MDARVTSWTRPWAWLAVVGLTVTLVVGGGHPAGAATPTEYINTYAPSAQTTQAQYQVPASVALAQSIHESGWGSSTLTVRHRNFFGIKCTSPNNPGPIAISCHQYQTQERHITPAASTANRSSYRSPLTLSPAKLGAPQFRLV